MKIKKVDDKPMVIHTKQKAKLHTHEPKQAAIKGSNVYTVDRDPTKKKADNGKYRKSTVHQVQKEGMFSKYRKQMKQAGQSIKVKDFSLRNAGMVGGKVMTDQIEGGQEIQQSAMIMYEASKPVTGTASRGAELFKRQVINQQKRKLKKVDAGKKIAKKGTKSAAKKVAIGCNQTVIKAIHEGGGNYVLPVKENQKRLLAVINEETERIQKENLWEKLDRIIYFSMFIRDTL